MIRSTGVGLVILMAFLASPLRGGAQEVQLRADGVRLKLVDTELRAAVQAIGKLLSKPVLADPLGDLKIEFFETPVAVPRTALAEILRGLVEANGLKFVEDSTFYRVTRPEAQSGGLRSGRGQPRAREPVEAQTITEEIELFTVRLKHARAADVAATLNQLYGTGAVFSRAKGLSSGTLSDELRRSRRGTGAEGDGSGEPAPVEPGATLSGAVTIVPDELTNSLLIRSTERNFRVLREGIAQLDVRPLQVLIEVIVVEARKDRRFALGFDVQMPDQSLAGGSVSGEYAGAGLGDLVVRVMGLGRAEINGTLTAARSRGDVEIRSRPVLLASNNTEAHLMVGTQQPFVSVSRSLPTDTPQRDQVVQYRDVGTKLTVRPTINQDGYVSLLIQQEISAATGETQFDAPVISSRETLTQILVRDGQTIVIGGLRDRIMDRVKSGVPLLVDIPVIGGLFGGTKMRTTETELFLFITTTIISDDLSAEAATQKRLPEELAREILGGDTVPPVPEEAKRKPGGGVGQGA